MSYERVFKPTQEAVDERLNVFNFCGRDFGEQLDTYKLELAIYCMQDHSDYNKIQNVVDYIKTMFNLIRSATSNVQKEYTKKEYEESKDHTFYFSGWQYTNGPIKTSDAIYVEQLLILATLTKNYDYFDESSRFNDKLEEIKNLINEFTDGCFDDATWEIINDFKEFELTEEDEDIETYNVNEDESDKTQEE